MSKFFKSLSLIFLLIFFTSLQAQVVVGIELGANVSSIFDGSMSTINEAKLDYEFNDIMMYQNNVITEKTPVAGYYFGMSFRYVSKPGVGIQSGFYHAKTGVKLYDQDIKNTIEHRLTYRLMINRLEAPLLITYTAPKQEKYIIRPSIGMGGYVGWSPSSMVKVHYFSKEVTYYEKKLIYRDKGGRETFDAGLRANFGLIFDLEESWISIETVFEKSLKRQTEFFNGYPISFSLGISYCKAFYRTYYLSSKKQPKSLYRR